MALIVRRAALRGPAAAVPTVLGLELGLYLWALFAAAGLAALIAASEAAYLILRVVGAAFLIYLGIRAWRSAWRDRGGAATSETTPVLTLAFAVGRAGAWLRRPRIRRRLEAVTGSVLIALRIRLAASSR